MMLGERRLWFWRGLLLLVAVAAVGTVMFLLYSHNRDADNKLVQTLIGVATATTGGATWLSKRARPAQLPVERAADELAKQLTRQWEQGAAERGLIHPAPMRVRWQWTRHQVTGPVADAVGGSGERRFAPLPGMAAVTEKQLRAGTLDGLVDVYGGLGSGRLIILGEPGTGKTCAGIWLLRDALAHRTTRPTDDRARIPVPVLITLHGWDPTVESLAEWLATRLAQDYPLLRAPEYGGNAAMRLIQGGDLAVILDGLDEMPKALRPVALRALDEQVNFRLIVLTRSQELVDAVSTAFLRGAAALELLRIDSGQAADYLASCQVNPLPAPWQRLVDHLRDYPNGVLAEALDTPLELALIRDTFGSEDRVDELTNVKDQRFSSVKDIENHLFGRALTAAYSPHPGRPALYSVDQAERWLGRLARWMSKEGTRDLVWWRIPHSVPAWPRVFFTAAAISAACVFLVGSLAGLLAKMHLFSAFHIGSHTVPVIITARILGYPFMFAAGLLVTSPTHGTPFPKKGQLRWSKTDIFLIFTLGAAVAIGIGFENGLLSGPRQGITAGIAAGFVIALGLILGGGPPQRLGRLRWCKNSIRTNLAFGVVVGLAAGLITGLVYGFGHGLRTGLMYAFLVAVGYLLVIFLGGRPSQERDQVLQSSADIPTILLIGLVIAIVSTSSYGIIYILIGTLGGRSPLQRSRRLRWSRTTTLTTLLTGLLTGVTLGLAYWLVYQLTHAREFTLGLTPGLTLGLGFGLAIGLLLGLRQPPTEATNPLDPQSVWRRERQIGLAFGLVFGLVAGVTGGIVDGLVAGLAVGLGVGCTVGILFGLGSALVSSAAWPTALASAQLRRRGDAPVRLLRFLDDARAHQILRTVGPAYQFRDTRLQDRLAEACATKPGEVAYTHVHRSKEAHIADSPVREPISAAEPSIVPASVNLGDLPLKVSTGARVRHPDFGVGTVLSIRPGAGHTFVEVGFDDPDLGTKTLREDLAPLHIVNKDQ
jgi:hypothetical protein